MATRVLVAVSHEIKDSQSDDSLLSTYCRQRAIEEVAPLVTNNSLLLVEGFDYDKFVPANSSHYNLLHNKERAWLGDKRPTFAGYDPRSTTPEMCDISAWRYDQWEQLVKKVVDTDWSIKPKDFKEAREMLKTGIPPAKLSRTVSRDEIELARWI